MISIESPKTEVFILKFLFQNNVEVNNLDALFHLNEIPVPKFDYHEAFAVKEPVLAEALEAQNEPKLNVAVQNEPDLIKTEENWANFSNFEAAPTINVHSQAQIIVNEKNDFNFSIVASQSPCTSNVMLPSDNASLKLKVPKSSSSDQVSLLSLDFKKADINSQDNLSNKSSFSDKVSIGKQENDLLSQIDNYFGVNQADSNKKETESGSYI